MTITDSRPAKDAAIPGHVPPVGPDFRAPEMHPTPSLRAARGPKPRPAIPVRAPTGSDSHATGTAPTTNLLASRGSISRPAKVAASSMAVTPGGAGRDPVAVTAASPGSPSLLDPALALAAEVLDDVEKVKNANANRLRILTATEPDEDGVMRGFGLDESHPDVARLAAMVAVLEQLNKDATRNLERHMRRHPLHGWSKSIRGVGDKQIARLLAAVGDPYWNFRDDKPRTVSALWAYCGLHVLPASQTNLDDRLVRAGRDSAGGDPGQERADAHGSAAGVAARRQKGVKANWSTVAKTRAYLIAESCLKQLVKPCHNPGDGVAVHVEGCACSPLRVVYDRRKSHTSTTRPEWTDGHRHADALRVVSKELLKDLWRAARELHGVPA